MRHGMTRRQVLGTLAGLLGSAVAALLGARLPRGRQSAPRWWRPGARPPRGWTCCVYDARGRLRLCTQGPGPLPPPSGGAGLVCVSRYAALGGPEGTPELGRVTTYAS